MSDWFHFNLGVVEPLMRASQHPQQQGAVNERIKIMATNAPVAATYVLLLRASTALLAQVMLLLLLQLLLAYCIRADTPDYFARTLAAALYLSRYLAHSHSDALKKLSRYCCAECGAKELFLYCWVRALASVPDSLWRLGLPTTQHASRTLE